MSSAVCLIAVLVSVWVYLQVFYETLWDKLCLMSVCSMTLRFSVRKKALCIVAFILLL